MTHERTLRAALALSFCASGVVASARPLHGFAPLQAQTAPGEVVIAPVESNLAEKVWVSVTAGSGQGSAADAIDQDAATAWRAEGSAAGHWLTLDLGGAYDNVRKVEIVFPDPTAAYRYRLEASTDGVAWDAIADRSGNAVQSRGATELFTRPGTRYVRVTIAGATPGATIGVSELRVFNYLRDDLVLGADLSNVDNFQNRIYYTNPNPAGENMGAGPRLLDVVKDRGMEFVRLRIFNEPRNEGTGEPRTPPTQGPERSLESAKWVREAGLGLGVDFHYADSWADPGKQPKPRAWAELEFDAMVTALHDFTYEYLRTLVAQGTTPDKVAIGNEIINGFLWGSESGEPLAPGAEPPTVNPPYFRNQPEIYQSRPGGRILWQYWKSTDPAERRKYDESWDRFTTLVAAGISAARSASPDSRIELHTIVGSGVGGESGLDKTMEFWSQLLTRVNAKGQDPDMLAISYYPEWHGTVEQLDLNLHTIASTYPQYRVNIAETAYPASGDTPQPNATFPRTVQGQADAIQRVFQAANDVIDNRGVGVLLWEPASFQSMFRPVPGMENHFRPLPSIDVFNRSHARRIVENNIYLTTPIGRPVGLPATVRSMDAATGVVSPLPVTWEAPPTGTAASAGARTVRGSTSLGAVTAIVDVI